MARKSIDDRIFLFIGGKAFTMKDLGPAADMRIDQAMQSILDQGLLGSEFVGQPWYEVIKSSGFQMECAPSEDETLQHSLYQKYQEAKEHCKELNVLGTLTQTDKDHMMILRKNWEAATKLAKP